MGFRLTIAKGLQEGREISFEDDEIKIGRTSENDVVLHDQGVSRRHARIFARGGRHYVTDLGSANGTSLNRKPLAQGKEQELRDGDRLEIGAVEFTFTPLTPPPGDSTRLVSAGAARPRTSTRITRASTELEMQAIEAENTGRHRTLSEQELAPPAPLVATATVTEMKMVSLPRPAAPATLLDMEAPTITEKGPSPASRAPARVAREAGAGMSAAERARLRREKGQTLGGQLRFWWAQLSPKGKSVAGVMTGLVLVAAIGTLLSVFRPAKGLSGPSGPEPSELGLSPLRDSFGLGDGVTWKRPDLKAFDFEFASPTRAVAVLHFQAHDISQKDEVSIGLNGTELGWVEPDNALTEERELTSILPLRLLRRNAPNQIVFDNVRNPPGQEPWRVWNVYVEVVPVPELPVEQLLAKAREEATAARRFYDQKDVGSENLFKSWKLYRSAWITLEALDEKPDLYEEVQYLLAQSARELDQDCRKLMLDFQRSVQFRDGDRAKATVEEVMRRFPTTEHRCHNLAIEKATQSELPI